jgi:predicted helicase
MNRAEAVREYLNQVTSLLRSGHAREHAYRPALERLMNSFDDVSAVNDPKRSAHGSPDFVFLKSSNKKIILGYAEAKDIGVSLAKTEKSNQLHRYGGYDNLFLTDYLEFRFFRNGEKYQTVAIAELRDGDIQPLPENFEQLSRELQEFLTLPPETIKSGKRLAQIMGGKARRIRDNVASYLQHTDNERNQDLEKIYAMMQKLLVHDLTTDKFADMYAQTLVYGLFVARYNDQSLETFDRREARDLVPKSNPFLQKFFDHIVGPDFDDRLAVIVDELCEVFAVSDVRQLVHKHLKVLDDTSDKDPIIHFYEDFLKEYDPAERKKMGAYYTPVPVVRFMIRQVDEILKKEFGLPNGIADTSKRTIQVETGQDLRTDRRKKSTTTVTKDIHRVQILDPAVGTATFLNEIIKYVHGGFEGQQGRWQSYVRDDLLPRLHGFELMMAPYTVAHLKLGMTLAETGVEDLGQRLGVYLTNTLEEGVKLQQDLFSFGLAEAISHEAKEAGRIKNEQPIMVVIGNPPYSGESSNKTDYANSLIDKYKFEPGGQQKLNERNPKWLNDDYVKFVSFSEDMIAKSGEGIVAMITNNGYLDNPTFRGMRWHLAKTFDKIYVLDLHGNAKKKEVSPDGSKDENVFDIMQGVSIVLASKASQSEESAEVYHLDVFGSRLNKFDQLHMQPIWEKLTLDKRMYYFVPKDTKGKVEYENSIAVNELLPINSVGIVTSADSVLIGMNLVEVIEQVLDVQHMQDDKKITNRLKNVTVENKYVRPICYKPFDKRHIYYDPVVIERPREKIMKNFLLKDNLGLIYKRGGIEPKAPPVFVADSISESRSWSRPGMQGVEFNAPLYLYHDDGTRTVNFDMTVLRELLSEMGPYEYYDDRADRETPPDDFWVTAIDVFDYIYGVLHSPNYRQKYKEFLKIDFPRVPKPQNPREFAHYAILGKDLRELHLMTSPIASQYTTTYPIAGSDEVEKLRYAEPEATDESVGESERGGRVYINDAQYFGNVPRVAWEFYIGGYQPAQKWLKDRKGRKLTSDDLDHYQKIIKVLTETDRIMTEIDKERSRTD